MVFRSARILGRDREEIPEHPRGHVGRGPYRATASLPLASASGVILGAAGFGWPVVQDFGIEQVRRLDLIAHMAAQVLDRANLYEAERERALSRERDDAQLFQDACLPRTLPQGNSLEVAATYLPASDAAMGGDWYDVFPVEDGMCLVIGDVTGHGLQSAATMAQLRNTVRAYAIEDPSPARVLTRLNRMMCRLEPGKHATAIVAVWDERSGTIPAIKRWSSANLAMSRRRVRVSYSSARWDSARGGSRPRLPRGKQGPSTGNNTLVLYGRTQ